MNQYYLHNFIVRLFFFDIMFRTLTTSSKIASYFAIYALMLVAIFGIIINTLYFSKWRHDTNTILDRRVSDKQTIWWSVQISWWKKWWLKAWWRWPRWLIREQIQVIDIWSQIQNIKSYQWILKNTLMIDDEYVVYRIVKNKMYYIQITPIINTQFDLLWITIIAMICVALLTYIISKQMVRQSLSHMNPLLKYVKHMSLETVKDPVPIIWPENDEIRQIAEGLQWSLLKIRQQSDALQDFVSHASHELKTPLMALMSTIDLISKTKDQKYLEKAKNIIWQIKSLLDTLLLITRWEYDQVHMQMIDLIPFITQSISYYQDQIIEKKILITQDYMPQCIVWSHPDILILIVSNLISNAIKYNHIGWSIHISCQDHILTVSNTGPIIVDQDQDKIYNRFYKKGNQTWHGLWLYLVKLLITKQWRKIYYNNHDRVNTFTVTMK